MTRSSLRHRPLRAFAAIAFAVASLCGTDGRTQGVYARGMTLHASAGGKRQAKAADRFGKGSIVTIKTGTKTILKDVRVVKD